MALKEEKEFAISGKQKKSVGEETNAKPTPNAAPSSEPPTPVWEAQPTAVQKLLETFWH